MKNFVLLIFALLFSCNLFSQNDSKNDVLNYYDTIMVGVKKYDAQDYDGAIKEYLKVPEGDTNYVVAVTELMLTYYQQKDHESAVKLAVKTLNDGYNVVPSFYLNLGSNLDQMERYEDAIKYYDIALKQYPMNYYLYFNKGYSYLKLKQYDKARDMFKHAIMLNPFYAKPHYQLAVMALSEGKTSLAIMALNAYLMINPNGEGSYDVLSLLNEVCSTKYGEYFESKGLDIAPGEDYSDIDLLVENYIALDKKYKVKSKIQAPFIKQTYLVFQKMSELPESDNFWYKMYVPVYKALLESDNFETYSYYISQTSQNKKHLKTIDTNRSKFKNLIDWLISTINKTHEKYELPFPNAKEKDLVVYRANKGFAVSFIGHKNKEGNLEGYGEYYYTSGALNATLSYNKDGKVDGKRVIYYENGNQKEISFLKDGILQDSLIAFSEYGRRKGFYTVKDDKLAGKVIHYYNSGAKSTEVTVVDDKQEGEKYTYYEVGQLSSKYNMTDNKANGNYVSYYDDGNLMEKGNYKDDLLEGPDTVFYRNGKIKIISNFKSDEYDGDYTKYYDNGQIHRQGKYINGKEIGKHITYNRDGTIYSESNYDESGKKNGVYREYYDDNKPYFELDYKKGDIVGYRYFNRDGKIIKEAKRKMGTFDYVGYHKNGVISTKGEYGTKLQQGKWYFYDDNGTMYVKNNFKDGNLEGKTTAYYPNGVIKFIENYKEDKKNGYYAEYYSNNTLVREGYFYNGNGIGEWKTYFSDGGIESRYYLLNDNKNGFYCSYTPGGKLYKKIKYEDDVIAAQWVYNSDEKAIDSVFFTNGCADVVVHFKNSDQPNFKYTVKNNRLQDDYYDYYPNGKKEIVGKYYAGKKVGKWTHYYINGNISSVGNYDNGDKSGIWKKYYNNGKLESNKNYRYGRLDGKAVYYYDNGIIKAERLYKDGDLEGESKFYSYTGEFDHSRFYNDNFLIAYEYVTINGKKRIDVKSETAEIKAYFKNGKPSREFKLDKGWFTGAYKQYYPTGQLFKVANYKDDDLQGDIKTYYADGTIMSEATYNKGDKNGLAKEYYPNGKVKKNTNYLQGYKNGEERIYDKNGKLIHHYIYYYGELIEIIL